MSLGADFLWLFRSSTLRLAVLLSAVFAIVMTTAVFIALTIGAGALERRVDATLQAMANAANLQGQRGDSFGIILRSTRDLNDLPRPFARVMQYGRATVELDDDFRQSETWRVLVSTDKRGAPILVAVPLDDGEEALELLGGALWVTVGIVVVLMLTIGLLTGIVAQRRLKRINATFAALADGDLTARTGITRSNDDLDEMARQLDVSADALERLVTQTRHLSASLAHDLRTPLARLRSRLEALPDGEERFAALEEAEHLSGIFDTIMRIARIEAGQGTHGFEEVALGDFAQDLAETFTPVVEDAGKSLTLSVKQPGTIFADKRMLVQAVANLIQNAIRHGGVSITLSVSQRMISVADNGPGVDTAEFAEIIKPMVRLDASRQTSGSGLGLALVRAVADRHRAALILAPHQPQGLSVTLKFENL